MRYLQRLVSISALAAVATGCGGSALVADPDTDFLEALRSQGGQEELIRHLSGDDPSGGGRTKELVLEVLLLDLDDSDCGHPGYIRVFADPAHCWPGIHPLTIVYTDGTNRVRAWLTRDHEEAIFCMAHLRKKDGLPYELRIYSYDRGWGTHIDDYRVTPTEIRRIHAEVQDDVDLGRRVRR